jgi:regulator of sigma E protease
LRFLTSLGAIPDNFIFQLNDEKGFLGYRLPVHIAKVVNGEAAEKAGLKADDHLVSVAGVTTPSFTEFTAELLKNKGKEVEMGVIRNGQPLSVKITPSDAGRVGIQLKQITDIYPT